MTTSPEAAGPTILDFRPQVKMWFEWAGPPEDPATQPWSIINVVERGWIGPPFHKHPYATETFAVEEGELELNVDGQLHRVGAGESLSIPPGVPHTLRNLADGDTRLLDTHEPSLDFPQFVLRLYTLIRTGKLSGFPPKDPKSLMQLSLLAVDHKRELVSVRPPQFLAHIAAVPARLLGMKLPPRTTAP
jgi:mannose-6-phosphate isomerase-like protein (cupin superfamily)